MASAGVDVSRWRTGRCPAASVPLHLPTTVQQYVARRPKRIWGQRLKQRLALGCALLTGFGTFVHAADETAQEARAWLERMSSALATRNYDARFLHVVGGHVESMRIIHRVANGSVTERLVSLDGSGRELVRTDTEVVCYLPDRRTVLVEKRTHRDSLLTTVPQYSASVQTHYTLATPGVTRLLGRQAQFVTVQPRDNLRYGYRLWLDLETAMPLKSQLCDSAGRVLEQIVFSELSTPATIDPALLKSAVVTDGFRWLRQEARAQRVNEAGVAGASGIAGVSWRVVNPPQGFRLTVSRMQTFMGAAGPVRHLVLSDGLASVSVFIEPKIAASGEQLAATSELARVGASLAYSTEVQQHRVTAMGEVPAGTLRAIATSVQREMVGEGAQTAPARETANTPTSQSH